MQAHLVQFDIQWESPTENYQRVRSLVAQADTNPGDLIALPELFDSGFTLETSQACDIHGHTLGFLRDLARETQCLIHGSRSILSPEGNLALNCATVLSPAPADLLCEYHKIHPFSLGSEQSAYQAGEQLAEYQWNGLRVCPAICYDLRFPELFRKGVINGAQIFVLGANWPQTRQHHWRSLLIARAIENQAFVIGINRTGDDPKITYAGGSIAIDPMGNVLDELDETEIVLSVDIDPQRLHQWRSKFCALEDIKIRSL